MARPFNTSPMERRHAPASRLVVPETGNLAEGTGKIRGISLQGNTQLSSTFTDCLEPFRTSGTTLVSPANTSTSDHMSFMNAGLLGFDFIQDPIEYSTRTHHTNLDTYERVQEDDMKYNAMVLASLAWLAAQRDEPLPRKPPAGRRGAP